MHRARSAILIAVLFAISSLPVMAESSGRAISCNLVDKNQLPTQFTVLDQECQQVSLGPLAPGTVVEFNISADHAFDFLVFSGNGLAGYANEQNYRSPVYWEEDTVFENMTGDALWHWTVPADQSESNWYVVLDNLIHPGDEGSGAQGGSMVMIDFDVTFPASDYWTLHDGLVRMGVNDHTLLINPALTLDEGTEIHIHALPLSGDPDIFILTEDQQLGYLGGNAPSSTLAELLQITSDASMTYTVDSTHAGIPLYIYADNEQGPTGGGDGQTEAIFTVIITLNPILQGVITADTAGPIDLGERLTLSANNTPNRSNQVDTSAFEWEWSSATITGSWAQFSWENQGNWTVDLKTHGVDGRMHMTSISVEVKDMTPPEAVMFGGSSNFAYGIDQPIKFTSASTDNSDLIQREEWWVDGALQRIDSNQSGNEYTHSFSEGGTHTVELRVYDLEGLSDATSIEITVSDISAPVLETDVIGPEKLQVGEKGEWSISATDEESTCCIWSWDFNNQVNLDSNGSASDDNEASGETVEWTFSDSGTFWITVTVTNDAGLSSTDEMVVIIESEPSSKSGTSSVVTYGIFGIIAVVILVAILFLIRRRRESLAHQEMLAVEAARREQEEAEAARQPSHEEQLTMFQKQDAGFSARASGDDYAQIAGVDSGYVAAVPQTTPAATSATDDEILSVFEEPISTPEPVTPEPVTSPTPAPAKQTKAGIEMPKSMSKGTVISSGIELPGSVIDVTKPDVVEKASIPPSEVQSETPSTTEVVGHCEGCGQRYAVDMPAEIDAAQIDCPKCGSRNTIRR
ncbi:MAG: PKD domain-containing protein [Candidatus Thermoplasmatota archaeon]|nr:PKD domain-containing protein [Candidatus Thermoplasmatota archaeon]